MRKKVQAKEIPVLSRAMESDTVQTEKTNKLHIAF